MPKLTMPKTVQLAACLVAASLAACVAALGFAALPAAATDKSAIAEQSKPKGSGDGELRPSTPRPQLPGADDEDKPKGSHGG